MLQQRVRLLFACLALFTSAALCAQQQPTATLAFSSSSPELNASFAWARQQALQYVSSGQHTIGPWYEAALPGRNAFCMRDVAHQTAGAATLGLFTANRNMLTRFAGSASASRDWTAYWEIDEHGNPSAADYRSDADFWFNLPANFDVLDAAVRMRRWTADPAYQQSPVFRRFYRRTLSVYLDRWALTPERILTRSRIMNRRQSTGVFVNARGIPSYTEGSTDFTVGVDLLAAEYRALRAYPQIATGSVASTRARQLQASAQQLQQIIESNAWSASGHHYFGLLGGPDGPTGSADTLVLYFRAARDPAHIRGALDFIADRSYWSQINIEEESYIPTVLFRYGRTAAAYDVLFDLSSPGKHRREYPEVSFAVLAALISGAMGIEPSEAGDPFDLRTLAQPLNAHQTLEVRSLRIRHNLIDVLHTGTRQTQLTNREGPRLRWKAQFLAPCGELRVNGQPVAATSETEPGGIASCSTILTLPPGITLTVTHTPAPAAE